MLTINLVALDEVRAELSDIGASQVPFATSLALNKTARDARGGVQDTVLPTRFTLRQPAWMKRNIRVTNSTKTALVAVVSDSYLAMGLQETGGTKIPYGKYLAVPLTGARPTPRALIDPANLPKAVMARGGFIRGNIMYDVVRKPDTKRKLIAGFFNQITKTTLRGIVPMYALVTSANIPPRYGFEPAVAEVVAASFPGNFATAFRQAVRTAKP